MRKPLETGAIIGNFKIIEALGSGGMGAVYKAWDHRLERFVALKSVDAQDYAQVEAEAKVLAQFSHDHIIAVYDTVVVDEKLYIIMQLVEGCNVYEASLRLPMEQTLNLLLDIAKALCEVHRAGYVHKDVKPENIIVQEHQTLGRKAYLSDFGLSHALHHEDLLHGHDSGTLGYMAPEHLLGADVDGRTDVYSFGLTLYKVLTGLSPQQESENLIDLFYEQIPEIRQVDPHFSRQLNRLVTRCVAKNPEARFASMEEVATGLEQVLLAPAKRRKRVLATLGGLALLLLVWGALVLLRPKTHTLLVMPMTDKAVEEEMLAYFLGQGLQVIDPALVRNSLELLGPKEDALFPYFKKVYDIDYLFHHVQVRRTGSHFLLTGFVQTGETNTPFFWNSSSLESGFDKLKSLISKPLPRPQDFALDPRLFTQNLSVECYPDATFIAHVPGMETLYHFDFSGNLRNALDQEGVMIYFWDHVQQKYLLAVNQVLLVFGRNGQWEQEIRSEKGFKNVLNYKEQILVQLGDHQLFTLDYANGALVPFDQFVPATLVRYYQQLGGKTYYLGNFFEPYLYRYADGIAEPVFLPLLVQGLSHGLLAHEQFLSLVVKIPNPKHGFHAPSQPQLTPPEIDDDLIGSAFYNDRGIPFFQFAVFTCTEDGRQIGRSALFNAHFHFGSIGETLYFGLFHYGSPKVVQLSITGWIYREGAWEKVSQVPVLSFPEGDLLKFRGR